MKYRVTKGIFEGHVFYGTLIDGRLWDVNTVGRSYPVENCEVVEDE